MKNPTLVFIPFLFLLGSCQETGKMGETKALKWCECNRAIVPLIQKLEDAQTPGQRQTILDSMRQVSAEISQCINSSPPSIETLDKELNDKEKDSFNKTFRRVTEEQCPEVFQALSRFEQQLEKK